ncbi:hypothetical protein BDN72DRAFT_761597 [Pluteus cervinus]|uniref:Uncharacterized protein n=1 Tax=Pluteus cervinus TaxID=181527 RepID=A0ACD3B6S5_9AGAR|nr:hypothetical protein BDN72DRAFT_761597 [Pluteus cervinus]
MDSDRDRSSSPAHSSGITNGIKTNGVTHDEQDGDLDPVARLQKELEKTRQEKEAFEAQYNGLVAKLTAMRATLGNKLKQDAEELDRREQTIQQLTSTMEILQEEVTAANSRADLATEELAISTHALEESQQEAGSRERDFRDTQLELERSRMERDEWEQAALQDRALAEDARSTLESLRRELEALHETRRRETQELEAEREKSSNLESVLQDFQAAKDHELRQAVKDYDSRLLQTTQSLAEFKSRALNAELQLEELQAGISRTKELEKEVKEKSLLIGKLRHEGVIMNEHLMEALRRLRRNSSETNVDRRLVTNVLLSFLTTPRTDGKRFEMLTLLASILSWSDTEREKAGLQRVTTPTTQPSSFWGRSVSGSSPNQTKPPAELEKTDETESFSRLWVEFLLTEASGGKPSTISMNTPTTGNSSLPSSPTGHSFPSSPLNYSNPARRLPSLTSSAMASTPSLMLSSTPSKKGKERAIEA